MNETILALVEAHGYHNPTSDGRNMGLYCHCGKYFPGGVIRGKHVTDVDMWRRHVKRVITRKLKETTSE